MALSFYTSVLSAEKPIQFVTYTGQQTLSFSSRRRIDARAAKSDIGPTGSKPVCLLNLFDERTNFCASSRAIPKRLSCASCACWRAPSPCPCPKQKRKKMVHAIYARPPAARRILTLTLLLRGLLLAELCERGRDLHRR